MRTNPLRAILVGGAIAGALDIADAIVFTWLAGGSAARMLRYIASGLLGQSSFDGGTATAALGLVLHFTIAFGAATVYVLASRQLPVLVRRPIVCGLAFGIAVLIVIRNVVLPLSAVRMGTAPMALPQLANQVLIHALGVGLPIALAARRWASPMSGITAQKDTMLKATSLMLFAGFVLLATPSSTAAQAATNPFTAMVTSNWNGLKKNLAASAALMPEAEYSFKPTPEVRSFGQIIGHLANDHYLICSGAKGEKNPNTIDYEKTTAKADLVTALNKSIAYCDEVHASMTDATGAQPVELFKQKYVMLGVLNMNLTHSSEHYGNVVTYLRLKGRVPPSSAGSQ